MNEEKIEDYEKIPKAERPDWSKPFKIGDEISMFGKTMRIKKVKKLRGEIVLEVIGNSPERNGNIKDQYEVEHELDNLQASDDDEFTNGWRTALSWVLGQIKEDPYEELEEEEIPYEDEEEEE